MTIVRIRQRYKLRSGREIISTSIEIKTLNSIKIKIRIVIKYGRIISI